MGISASMPTMPRRPRATGPRAGTFSIIQAPEKTTMVPIRAVQKASCRLLRQASQPPPSILSKS
ncbi:hypothetical protein D3C87_1939490 [compost metagenome]